MESERERRKQQWRQRSEGEGAARSLRKRLTDVVLTKESCRTPEQKKLIALHHVKTSEIAEAMAAKASKKARQVDRALEKEDSPAELTRKLSILADMVREAASSAAGSGATSLAGVVLHTGAGLSTTAGIPDFRGPNGVWTMAAKGRQVAMGLTYEEAVPTAGHMAIAGLVAHGLVSHVVSQNVDGLHLRSSVPPARLSELHGNVFVERCPACGRTAARPFDVTAARGTGWRRHRTGGNCGGRRPDAPRQPEAAATSPAEAAPQARGAADGRALGLGGGDGAVGSRTDCGEERAEMSGWSGGMGGDAPDDVQREEGESGSDSSRGSLGFSTLLDGAYAGGEDGGQGDSWPPAESAEGGVGAELGERKQGLCGSGRSGRSSGVGSAWLPGSGLAPEGWGCGSPLVDTIVHFGERIDPGVLQRARQVSAEAGLAICLGTSLKVPPASCLPRTAQRLAIVNLQWTAKDRYADLKIHAPTDVALTRLAELLAVAVPTYERALDPVLGGGRGGRAARGGDSWQAQKESSQECGRQAAAAAVTQGPPRGGSSSSSSSRRKGRQKRAARNRGGKPSFPRPAKVGEQK